MKFDEFPDSHNDDTKSKKRVLKNKNQKNQFSGSVLFGLSVPEIYLTHEKYNKKKRRKLKFPKIINR